MSPLPQSSPQPQSSPHPQSLPQSVAGLPTPARKSFGAMFWIATSWLVALVAAAIFAPVLPLSDPTEIGVSGPREGPSFSAFFGTDALGRDVFARTIHGAKVSLTVGGVAIVLGMIVGGGLGVIAGAFKRWVGHVVSWTFLVMLAFPGLVLAILITATLDRSLLVVSLTLGLLSAAPVGRLARATTLVFAKREFVSASRVLGARKWRIIAKELLPCVLVPMGALLLLGLAVVIVAEGSLAFLGLSVSGDDAISWGKIIVDGAGIRDLEKSPHVALFPIATMFVTVLALNYLGDRIRQRFDVKELAF